MKKKQEKSLKEIWLEHPGTKEIAERWFREKPKPPWYKRSEFWQGVRWVLFFLGLALIAWDGATKGDPSAFDYYP